MNPRTASKLVRQTETTIDHLGKQQISEIKAPDIVAMLMPVFDAN